MNPVQRRMQRDGMVREFEYQVYQREQTILWLSDSATAVRDERGRVVRHEGTVRDITDQRRAEHALLYLKYLTDDPLSLGGFALVFSARPTPVDS